MSDPTPPATPPANWYPDTANPGQERYWDGTEWTDQVQPLGTGAAGATGPTPVAPKTKPSKKLIIGGSIAAAIVLFIAIGAANAGSKDADPEPPVTEAVAEVVDAPESTIPDVVGITAKEADVLLDNAGLEVEFQADDGFVVDKDNWTVTGTTPAAGTKLKVGDTVVVQVTKTVKEEVAPVATAEPVAPAAPALSLAQQNVVRKAQSYLDYSGFSRQGLIEQLEFEGFSPEDSTFGADNAGADWNAEAAEKAKSYMAYSAFSRDGLYDQMAFENFTDAEILFALAQVGY